MEHIIISRVKNGVTVEIGTGRRTYRFGESNYTWEYGPPSIVTAIDAYSAAWPEEFPEITNVSVVFGTRSQDGEYFVAEFSLVNGETKTKVITPWKEIFDIAQCMANATLVKEKTSDDQTE